MKGGSVLFDTWIIMSAYSYKDIMELNEETLREKLENGVHEQALGKKADVFGRILKGIILLAAGILFILLIKGWFGYIFGGIFVLGGIAIFFTSSNERKKDALNNVNLLADRIISYKTILESEFIELYSKKELDKAYNSIVKTQLFFKRDNKGRIRAIFDFKKDEFFRYYNTKGTFHKIYETLEIFNRQEVEKRLNKNR